MYNSISIGTHRIGLSHRPFIIAEMSGNHNKSIDRALQIVEAASMSGAHAIKLQTYTADAMTLNISNPDFTVTDNSSLWYGKRLYDLYEEASTPYEWHEQIFAKALSLGLIPFSTPFDLKAVQFLEKLNCPIYKIASFENTDHELIKLVAQTGKPVIISTGMASISELDDAVTCARAYGCKDLILLKCTSSYPSSPLHSNILTIPHMRDLFKCEVGLSDHTSGIGAATAAVAHGATVIEKHFTLARSDGGVDAEFSLEPLELKNLVDETERAWQSLGSVKYGVSKSEEPSKLFRRSLYIVDNIKCGDRLSRMNTRAIRPGFGLSPKLMKYVLGRKVNRDIEAGTALSWDLLE